ncbi:MULTISPECIES: ankyrin repeat domain-containing protein [Microbulbifer]|uniref:Ankyrin repeat-containing protein n=1 Tax=Microbulbifer yueqingensis TaxID=658219 RepID=A0A1G9EDA6_9GAMM|nr:ankyrin repeat domain-containing protein [Microbulbifer yueqingensis]SDK74063.1 Ankyrin repeat-containing protein [Microbulbifer yueqingensis]
MFFSLYYKFRESPIFEAIEKGDETKILSLAAKRYHLKSKDKWGSSVLTAAAQAGNEKLVKKFVDLGLDVNHVSKNSGSSPLIGASIRGHIGIVKALIISGADVNIATSDSDGAYENMTPLMWAANRGYLDVASLLLEAGANINSVNGSNTTATMFVAENQSYNIDMFRLLMKYGPDLTIKDWRGRTVEDEVEAWSKNSNRHEMKEIVERARHA